MIDFKLTEEERNNILRFQGYGNPNGKIWFVGLEEGTGKAVGDDEIHNLHERGNFPDSIMGLAEAHSNFKYKGKNYNFDHRTTYPTTQWLWMSRLMLALHDPPVTEAFEDKGKSTEYIHKKLGSKNGDTFLTEFSSIPNKSHTKDSDLRMYMERKVPDLISREVERKEKLRGLLKSDQNLQAVVCYGIGGKEKFLDFLDVKAGLKETKISKDGKKEIKYFSANAGKIQYFIVPQLRNDLGAKTFIPKVVAEYQKFRNPTCHHDDSMIAS